MPTVDHSSEFKPAALEVPVASRDDFNALARQVLIEIRSSAFQRMTGFCLHHGTGNHPQAELLTFQSGLAIGDQRIEEVFLRLVKETKVCAPGHVADDVDSALAHIGCHRERLPIFSSEIVGSSAISSVRG